MIVNEEPRVDASYVEDYKVFRVLRKNGLCEERHETKEKKAKVRPWELHYYEGWEEYAYDLKKWLEELVE